MSEKKYIYGVDEHWSGRLELQRTEVTKETPKLYYVKRQDWTGYRSQVPKDEAFLTSEAAIGNYIARLNRAIQNSEKQLTDLLTKMDKAQALPDTATDV